MPSPPKLVRDRDTGIYFIRWTEPGPRGRRGRSKRQSTRTSDVAKATTFFAEWLKLEQSSPMPGEKFTVADLWSIYDKKHVQVNVIDGARIDNAWKNLAPHFGALAVSGITDDIVSAYTAKRASGAIGEPANGGTVRLELSYLIACLNWCSHKKRKPPLVDRAAVPHIELPPASEPRDRWLTTDEIQRLLAAAAEMRQGERLSRIERFLWLALETAARKTAIYTLPWSRVDFETGVIDYNEPGRARTKKRRAVVPISKALLPVLQRAYAERGADDLVMTTPTDIADALDRVAVRAGVPDVSPHVLRHTAATHMARRRVPLWLVAKVLGNTLAMTERVYAKHCPEDLREAVNTISGGAEGVGL